MHTLTFTIVFHPCVYCLIRDTSFFTILAWCGILAYGMISIYLSFESCGRKNANILKDYFSNEILKTQ